MKNILLLKKIKIYLDERSPNYLFTKTNIKRNFKLNIIGKMQFFFFFFAI